MFEVLDPGGLCTLQDAGRRGSERFGVPVSGAMDWFALRAANRLTGNVDEATVLEFAFQGPVLSALTDCLVAVTGPGWWLQVDDRRLPGWTAVAVRAGQTLRVRSDNQAFWGVLAAAGGLDGEQRLGSTSTYLAGKFGGLDGRPIQTGDLLRLKTTPTSSPSRAGHFLPASAHPAYAQKVSLRVLVGPQEDWFGEEGLSRFFESEYGIGPRSDRMGYRLEGPLVPRREGSLLSEGMVLGALQVPPDGQPILMMADRPTTGGYPKIGAVITADLPLAAQLLPGTGRVSFHPVSLEEAHRALAGRTRQLDFIESDEDFGVAI